MCNNYKELNNQNLTVTTFTAKLLYLFEIEFTTQQVIEK